MDSALVIVIIVAALAAGFVVFHLWRTTPQSFIVGGIAWMWVQVKSGSAVFGIAAGIVGFVGTYLIHCAQRPRQRCIKCGGESNRKDATGWNSRYCWWCQGRGRKTRFGARLWGNTDD